MSQKTNDSAQAPRCPLCGSIAEAGSVSSLSRSYDNYGVYWRSDSSSIFKFSVSGTVGSGIRCLSCRRIVLDFYSGEDGPGLELVNQASDLERDGEWDRAIALYRRVLESPEFVAHHSYAKNGIIAIEAKRESAT